MTPSSQSLSPRDAVILVGGKGTRLASVVSDVAKPMAPVDGRPFVDVIVARLRAQGIRRIIMATGHKAHTVSDYFTDHSDIICVHEDALLGTGGAVLNVIAGVPDLSDPFFVLNGDSIYPFALHDFDQAPDINAQMGVVVMGDAARYGTVSMDNERRIHRFVEKTGIAAPGFVNAGLYCLRKSCFLDLPLAPCSLEKDIFPALASAGQLQAVPNAGPMLDIGLPETYSAASLFLNSLTE